MGTVNNTLLEKLVKTIRPEAKVTWEPGQELFSQVTKGTPFAIVWGARDGVNKAIRLGTLASGEIKDDEECFYLQANKLVRLGRQDDDLNTQWYDSGVAGSVQAFLPKNETRGEVQRVPVPKYQYLEKPIDTTIVYGEEPVREFIYRTPWYDRMNAVKKGELIDFKKIDEELLILGICAEVEIGMTPLREEAKALADIAISGIERSIQYWAEKLGEVSSTSQDNAAKSELRGAVEYFDYSSANRRRLQNLVQVERAFPDLSVTVLESETSISEAQATLKSAYDVLQSRVELTRRAIQYRDDE